MKYLESRHRSMIAHCDAHRRKRVAQGDNELLGYYCTPESRKLIEETRIGHEFGDGLERLVLVIPEYTPEIDSFEEAVSDSGKRVIRHIVEDADLEVDEEGRLAAFLPGASLRTMMSIFSEQD